MSEPLNGKAPEPGKTGNAKGPEQQAEPADLPLAALFWGFGERLILGESPDPGDLLSACPSERRELEGALSLLYLGKALLSGEGGDATASGEDPCRPGAVLDDYRIEGEIGRGGMGIVYQAEQISLKRRVALKVLPRVLGLDSPGLRRFQREACMAAALHHTNIVPVYGFGIDQGVAYYSMELICGPSLDRVIRDLSRAGSLPATGAHLSLLGGDVEGVRPPGREGDAAAPVRETRSPALAFARKAAWLMSGVAEGLHSAHQRGIIHRDLKPANLMLSAAGHLVIADFGVARMRDPGAASSGAPACGTPHYMSPEQAERRSGPIDHRTDIYSLGVTLYELLTLRLPFGGQSSAEVLDRVASCDPLPPVRHNPHLPGDLAAIVLRAMEKSPARRYQTALELSNDLRRFVLGEPVKARRPRPGARLVRAVLRRWKPLAVSLALLALASFGGWAYHQSKTNEQRFQAARKSQLLSAARDLLAGEPLGLAAVSGEGGAEASVPLRAAELLTGALALDPRDGQLHFLRGNAWLEAGRLSEAANDFTRAIDLGSTFTAAARFRRGTALGWLGRTGESALDIAAALELAPEDPQVLLYRGFSAQAEGRVGEAIDLFRGALEREPSLRPEVFHRLALCHYGREDYDQAIACLRVVLGLRPRWISPWSLLLQIGLRRSEPAIVAEVLGTLRRWPPPDAEARLLLGLGLQFAGDLKGMREVLAGLGERDSWSGMQPALFEAKLAGDERAEEAIIERRLREQPQDHRALMTLGQLRHRQRRFEEALDAYRRADPRSGRKWTALLSVGETLLHLNLPAEAAGVLEQALQKRRRLLASGSILTTGLDYPVDEIGYRLDPETRRISLHPPGHQNPRVLLGEAYRILDRHAESQATLEAAASEHPRSADVRRQLGLTLAALGRMVSAVREFEEAKRLGEDGPQIDAVLSHLHSRTGRIDRARDCLREGLRAHPRSAQLLLAQAQLDLLTGQPDAAAARCEAAIALGEIPGFCQVALGRAKKAAGRREEARRAFLAAAEADPRWNQPRYELGLLDLEARDFVAAERELRLALEKRESPPAAAQDVFCSQRVIEARQVRHELAVALLGQGTIAAAESELSLHLGAPAVAPAGRAAVAGEVIEHLRELRGWEEASRFADSFVTRNPGDGRVLLERAKLLLQRSPEAARRDLERAIELDPASPVPYLLLAQVLDPAGDSAEEVLRRGSRASPRVPALRRSLAAHLMQQKRDRECVEILRRLFEESPADRLTRNDLAWALLTASDAEVRDFSGALALARPLLEEAPDQPAFLNTCGLAFLRAGMPEEARDAFLRADWLSRARGPTPERGENLLLLSAALSALGNGPDAEKALEEGKAMAPESDFREEAEQALRQTTSAQSSRR